MMVLLIMNISLWTTSNLVLANDGVAKVSESVSIRYDLHFNGLNWDSLYRYRPWSNDGDTSGFTRGSYCGDALRIILTNNKSFRGSVEYSTHMQGIGWQTKYYRDGATAGSINKNRRIEAFKIRLTDQLAEKYDIYYRSYVQTFGWMGWSKNDQPNGSQGYSKRIQAIQIILVDHNGKAPGNTNNAFLSNNNGVSYRTHVQTYGWQKFVSNSQTSGTSGQSKRLEGINIHLNNQPYTGDILYRTHIQTYGWESGWKKNNQLSGTYGRSKRLEAIQIKLSGQMAENFNIYYRVHIQHYGWLAWATDGASAGSAGYAYRLEAIEICLVDKQNTVKPTSSAKIAFMDKSQSITSKPDWTISELKSSLTNEQTINTDIDLGVDSAQSGLSYRFTYKNKTLNQSGVISEYSKANRVIWAPKLSGIYTLNVTAKDALGNEQSKSCEFEINHGVISSDEVNFSAHRGFSAWRPENSIAAYKYAAGVKGVWAIDADLVETKDGKFVCSHYDDLSLKYQVNQLISKSNYDEIKDLSIKVGNNIDLCTPEELRLPTLEDYLTICQEAGKIPQIEMKQFSSLDSIKRFNDILTAYGFGDSAYVHSLNCLELEEYRNINPNIKLVYAVENTSLVDLEWLKNRNIGVSLSYDLISDDLIATLSDYGIEIYAYVVDDKYNAGQLIERGITFITTNTNSYFI